MVRDPALVKQFHDDQLRREKPDYRASLAIFEALWQEARTLGVLPSADPLEGIEIDIRLAEALHVRNVARGDRPGT